MIKLIPQPKSYIIQNEKAVVTDISEDNITRRIDNSYKDEAYKLEIFTDGITLTAATETGFYYAGLTLRQLSYNYNGKLPCMIIDDAPRYQYRGFLIDCARHMFSTAELKKMINAAAEFKFNVFHWHLTDDQGFRFELSGHCEVTLEGSVRSGDRFGKMCVSDKPYSGYYTKDEMREIVSFCHERHISVVPELDMPGHTSALLHSHPELSCTGREVAVRDTNGIFKEILCAGNPHTYDMLYDIIDEFCEIFTDGYFHIGGDEAPKKYWEKCSKCKEEMHKHNLNDMHELQGMFINRIASYLEKKNKKCISWNESLKGDKLGSDIIVERWMEHNELSAEHAKKGGKLILAPFSPYYCDYPYSMNSLSDVYNHEASDIKGMNEAGKDNILGLECALWTEFINSDKRLEYLSYPRFIAVAESAWTAPDKKNYKSFKQLCLSMYPRLIDMGIHPADEKDLDMNVFHRAGQTVSFFNGFIK